MRIFTEQALKEFIAIHPETEFALQEWKYVVRHCKWKNYAELKDTFNSADLVGKQHYVFNIMGNKYRIVAVVKFSIQFIYIRFIGTHQEYDRIRNIENI